MHCLCRHLWFCSIAASGGEPLLSLTADHCPLPPPPSLVELLHRASRDPCVLSTYVGEGASCGIAAAIKVLGASGVLPEKAPTKTTVAHPGSTLGPSPSASHG